MSADVYGTTEERAYNGLGAVPPVGSRGKASGGGQGANHSPPEAESILKCRRLIFVLKYCAHNTGWSKKNGTPIFFLR